METTDSIATPAWWPHADRSRPSIVLASSESRGDGATSMPRSTGNITMLRQHGSSPASGDYRLPKLGASFDRRALRGTAYALATADNANRL